MTCVCICLYETTYVIKSISGRVRPKGCLQINKSLRGWFIIRSTSGRIHPKGCLEISKSPQADELIIQSTNRRVHY